MRRRIEPSETPSKILLVEDNEEARSALRRALEWFGHRVFEAGSAREAEAIWLHQLREFDVLVTDVVLPGQTGVILAESLLKERPDLRVLFLSGYTDREVSLEHVPDARTSFLEKPVTIRDLGVAVDKLLMRDPPRGGKPVREEEENPLRGSASSPSQPRIQHRTEDRHPAGSTGGSARQDH